LGGVGSQEPALRKNREGWGTLKFSCCEAPLEIEEHRQECLCHMAENNVTVGELSESKDYDYL
jgi:hypothetical protein